MAQQINDLDVFRYIHDFYKRRFQEADDLGNFFQAEEIKKRHLVFCYFLCNYFAAYSESRVVRKFTLNLLDYVTISEDSFNYSREDNLEDSVLGEFDFFNRVKHYLSERFIGANPILSLRNYEKEHNEDEGECIFRIVSMAYFFGDI